MATGASVTRRTISLRAFAGTYAMLTGFALGVWALGFGTGIDVHPAIIVLIGVVPLVVGVAYTWIIRATTEYRIYEDAIEVESGVLSKSIDHLQLFRIRDLGFQQSLIARMLGIGTVLVTSTDRSTPHLSLRGVGGARDLYETLRQLVSASQATRRTMVVEDDSPPPSS